MILVEEIDPLERQALDIAACARRGLTMYQTSQHLNVSKASVLEAATRFDLKFADSDRYSGAVYTLDPAMMSRDEIEFELLVLRNKQAAIEGNSDVERTIVSCGLTRLEGQVFQILHKKIGGYATIEQIHDWLYAQEADAPDPKIINVVVSNMRKKLAVNNSEFAIGTVWGHGFKLVRIAE